MNPMFRSILPALLLSLSTPVMAQGVWLNGTYFENAEEVALCQAVAAEVQDGVDEGLFSEDYAVRVLEQCLRWANP